MEHLEEWGQGDTVYGVVRDSPQQPTAYHPSLQDTVVAPNAKGLSGLIRSPQDDP
jgi:hypothetical protein